MIESYHFGRMAVDLFNEWAPRRKTLGAFHLTC